MKRLTQKREGLNLTRFDLSGPSHVPAGRIGQIELGREVPPPQSVVLRRLADALGYDGDPADLLDDVETRAS